MSQPPFDPSIPVLTEVLKDSTESVRKIPPPTVDHGEQLEELALKQWSDQDWHMLERRLSERILHQLQGRVDFVLEQRIKDCMAEALERALEDFTGALRSGLQDTIEQIVTRAVSQELTHLQTLKK
ncbi:hypothetical protein [Janthinobacterium fluminis]|uniref:DUF2486 family protein n=1 Tax=Janthinobacterium fluminis TaxID=2987524 RepID=A0ABT5K1Z3_9BURK|nr:hypothetical protein [Janthinobacterium fluminis]MDC8759002.1 hypothetical protein [Janthinobacterium fluminis]